MASDDNLFNRYFVYLSCADDGHGRDITTGCKTYLRTFSQWLHEQPGDPVEQDREPD